MLRSILGAALLGLGLFSSGFLCPSVASAVQVAITNPGFEDPVLNDGISSPITPGWGGPYGPDYPGPPGFYGFGWSLNPSTSDMNGGNAPEGNNMGAAIQIGEGGNNIPTPLYQQTAALLTANTLYTLHVAVGHPIPNAPTFGAPITYAGYTVELDAGGSVLTMDNSSVSIAQGDYQYIDVTFTALPGDPQLGQPVVIQLSSPGLATYNGAYFDNVTLTATPVPEPATIALFGLGVIALIDIRRRCK